MPTPARRRWFQFKLRTLLIAVVVLSIPLSWLAAQLDKARRQRAAVEAIEGAGGEVFYDTDDPDIPRIRIPVFLYTLLGRDFLDEVCVVGFAGPHTTDATLHHLEALTSLEGLLIFDTQVTDAGLQHLRGLTELRTLWLAGNRISDAGLRHLTGLRTLRMLDIDESLVSDQGVVLLRKALPQCEISWSLPPDASPETAPASLPSETDPSTPLPTR